MEFIKTHKPQLKIGILSLFLLISMIGGGLSVLLVTIGVAIAGWRVDIMADEILAMEEGDDKMKRVADAIREGSDSFFTRMYGSIGKFSLPVAGLLVILYGVRDDVSTIDPNNINTYVKPSHTAQALVVGLSFLSGAACSTAAGYFGLWISVRTNVRTSAAAAKLVQAPGSTHPLAVALKGGAVAAVLVVGMVVGGITFLYSLSRLVFPQMDEADVPMLLVGFGFGASFVALFAQLGGGIFTKAADVGADLCGKLEAGIPEDDHRNPAVIADLVGDNVGDCAARGADLFESISAEIISSMILGGSLAKSCGFSTSETRNFIIFPLVVHMMDLFVSGVGVFASLRSTKGATPELDPISTLKRGHRVAMIVAILGLVISTRVLLYTEQAPNACWYFFGCAIIGAMAGFLSIVIAEYYTDVPHPPVQSIVLASSNGHATNVIAGLSVGLSSTGPSALVVGVAILSAYWLGDASGLVTKNSSIPTGGLYGTAVATMGALSCGAYVLAMDVFGPISDNAGGICEMSEQTADVRHITDKLDAVGNSTKAATKSFALTTATLASFLLLRAFMDEVHSFTGAKFDVVDVTQPEVFVAGLAGSTLIFVFSGYAVSAVGIAAGDVVNEVRRQFREIPGIMEGTAKPEYGTCVDIVAKRALELMFRPGLLALATPVIIGLIFKLIGAMKNDSLMGPRAIVGFLVFNTATGILMGLFLSNAGGSWDNAKKAIEARSGVEGKGSDAHKAAVTGDTVGDPLKDCAGPSLHVVLKLTSTTALVMAPFFIA
jgi:H(+)-translocating pyrophosphatase